MRLLTVPLFALLGLTLASTTPPLDIDDEFLDALEARQTVPHYPKFQCAKGVHIIADSGGSNPPHGYGGLDSTADEVLKKIPGSNTYSVPYPKYNVNPHKVEVGVKIFKKYFKAYTHHCPDTPIVLLGFSSGAIIQSNALCGRSKKGEPETPPFPSKYAKYIIATIAYGDETFHPHLSYDRGTCKHGHGIAERQNVHACHAFADTFRQYCDNHDSFCCRYPHAKYIKGTHHKYPSIYNKNAVDFIARQYKAHKAAAGVEANILD